MKRIDLLHIKEALEDAQAEFEELQQTLDWYVTMVPDRLASAMEIILSELQDGDSYRREL